ncbi:MAG TPA: hypothetical protein VEN99_01280 [Acidimicrobiia bacterium]|nr:hypothetical protein [Acidimicrobiia bacterium]
MAGTAVVALGCGGEPTPVDVPAVADSVRALVATGWHVVLLAPPAPPGAGVAGPLALALGQSRSGRRAVPVVTHTLVDPADPALAHPPATAFPEPLAVLEAEAIAAVVKSGFPVVVAGQIPVVPNGANYRAVAVAVDDAASARRLAGDLGAEVLVFVAGDNGAVPAGPAGVGEIDVNEAERRLAEEPRFAPELRAAVRFLRAGGELAVIVTAAGLPGALDGAGGGLRIHRTLAGRRSDAPVLAAGWC